MRIAYVLSWDLGRFDGVTKKVFGQIDIWKSLGNEVKIFNISKSKNFPSSKSDFFVYRQKKQNPLSEYSSKNKAFKLIYDALLEFAPNIVYLRSDKYTFSLLSIIKTFNTVIEVNSNSMEEANAHFINQPIQKFLQRNYSKYGQRVLFKYTKGIVFVTNELEEIETTKGLPISIKKNVFPNGIVLSKIINRKTKTEGNIPKLVMSVSHVAPWYGLDKIFELAKCTIGLLEFHIIGEIQEKLELSNIVYHEFLEKNDYYNLITSKTDIGIGSLALHRINLKEACPLKVREYLALGLPTIIGYEDTAFTNKETPKWLLKLPNTSNNLIDNKEKIIEFAQKMKDFVIPTDEVREFIDSKILEKKRLGFFERILKSKSKNNSK